MRQQPLTGYLLHQRPYQENRSLMTFFSQEFGLIHGVGKKNLPLFIPIQVFATGKNNLKTFSQSQAQTNTYQLTGKALYIGFYLNELLVKLLPMEENCETIWQHYQQILVNIQTLFDNNLANQAVLLKWYLRQFENVVMNELGYAIDFANNYLNQPLQSDITYYYQWQQGFVNCQTCDDFSQCLTGKQILNWQDLLNNPQNIDNQLSQPDFPQLLTKIGAVYRQIIDNLLNYQPLNSRVLWQQLTMYQ